MNTKAITVLKIALEGPVDVIDLIGELKIQPWQIYSHIRMLREKSYVVLEGRQIRLTKNWKAQLLEQVSKDIDITKVLHDSNEEVLSFLTKPVSIDVIVRETDLSRATVYRALKEFLASGIAMRSGKNYELNTSIPALISFARWLESERSELEALR